MAKITTISLDPQYNISQFTPDGITKNIDELIKQTNLDPPPIKPFGSIPRINGSPIDFKYLLQLLRVNPNELIESPPVVISFETAPLCTLGNLSLLIGKAKSRKTFLLTSIAAAALSGHCNIDGLAGDLPKSGEVYYFDTEQSKYHLYLTVNRICNQADQSNPNNFHAYGLRPLTPAQRIKLIEYVVQRIKQPAFIIIDGLRDLLSKGINDEAEATELMSKFLKWTYEKNCHILLVLHQNKNDQNARGHIGTEAVNKAETVLSLRKDTQKKEITIVTPEFCRDIDFEPFNFIIDKHGLPERTSIIIHHTDRKLEAMREFFTKLLTGMKSMGYNKLTYEYSEMRGVSLPTAKRHISLCTKADILINNSNGNYQLKFQPESDLEE